MPVNLRVKLLGNAAYIRALREVDPKENPEVVRRFMRKSGKLIQSRIRKHMSGPRPRNLGQVTGELAASIAVDASQLPRAVSVGVPGSLFWFEFHEVGLGRFKRRAAVEPGLEEAMRDIPDILLEEWRDSVRGAAS